MKLPRNVAAPALLFFFVGCATIAACGGDSGTGGGDGGGFTSGTETNSGTNSGSSSQHTSSSGLLTTGSSQGNGGSGGSIQGFDVEPAALQEISVAIGATSPTVAYAATVDGQPKSVKWQVDRGDVGSVDAGPAATTKFKPTGEVGGLVHVVAGLSGTTVSRDVLVKLHGQQNGPSTDPKEAQQIPGSVDDLKNGGGVGGVGGDGLGVQVSDDTTLQALGMPSDGSTQHLAMLYPYDATVFPRGLQAPLLQWGWDIGDADAIRIELKTTSGSFQWSGTFGRPAILTQTGKPFIRHPIPQDIWDIATNTAGGTLPDGSRDKLTVKLTVARGGVAYGPATQTWNVAPARLTGTVYYNSYGTHYVKNWAAPDGAGRPVGAAILGIRSGDNAPKLIVGKDADGFNAAGIPTDDNGCRVCHVVSSRGNRLITQSEQHADGFPGDARSFLYDLTASDIQGSVVTLPQEGVFAWAAMNGDATYALTNTIDPSSSNPAISGSTSNTALSGFYQFGAAPVGAPITGLLQADGVTPVGAGYPSYSPDDKLITYIDVTGRSATAAGDIMVAPYDAATQTFGKPIDVHPAANLGMYPKAGYPVFLPDNGGVLFELQVRQGGDNVLVTRNGARSELWWLKYDGNPNATAVQLNAANGKKPDGTSYLPIEGKNHGTFAGGDPRYGGDDTAFDDTTLNYEPTILPIVAGGYAWVVFTSRRAYGNTLTDFPWKSWPPDYDTADLNQATVKKLWVAAIDLNAPAGSDPSHPAFYLPAQELLAGNSRGFWVLDPCRADGTSCDTGDQCCNGFCEAGSDGALVCSNMPPDNTCSKEQEKCTTAADCCDSTNDCINGFCANGGPH